MFTLRRFSFFLLLAVMATLALPLTSVFAFSHQIQPDQLPDHAQEIAQKGMQFENAIYLMTPVNCSCVVYVQNRFKLSKPWVNYAKDMGSVLSRNGFKQITVPMVGAVVVMSTKHSGADPIAGHVGIIEKLSMKPTKYQFTLRQGDLSITTGTTEYNCNNINSINWAAYLKTATTITYWFKK